MSSGTVIALASTVAMGVTTILIRFEPAIANWWHCRHLETNENRYEECLEYRLDYFYSIMKDDAISKQSTFNWSIPDAKIAGNIMIPSIMAILFTPVISILGAQSKEKGIQKEIASRRAKLEKTTNYSDINTSVDWGDYVFLTNDPVILGISGMSILLLLIDPPHGVP